MAIAWGNWEPDSWKKAYIIKTNKMYTIEMVQNTHLCITLFVCQLTSSETCSSQLFTLHFHDKNNLKGKHTV